MTEPAANRSIRIEESAVGSAIDSGDGNIIYVIQHSTEHRREEATPKTAVDIGPNPYKGLAAFKESDADRYFGREAQIERLWQRFQDLVEQSARNNAAPRLLPILGPSGCGKSSLARAGFIPELARRPLPGKDHMRVAVLMPGSRPLEALAGVLAKVATDDPLPVQKVREFEETLKKANDAGECDGLCRIANHIPDIQDDPIIILVDQFQEVFTLCSDPGHRQVFINNLLHASSHLTSQVSVVITLSSDYLGETQRYARLNQVITSDQSVIVPAMTAAELRRAIAEPAKQAGHPLDEAMVNLLVKDTEGLEGALPLLQFALTRLWDGMSESKAPAVTYLEMGGVGGALAGKAQEMYDRLDPPEKEIARRIFIGLVQLGEGTRYTRRRVSVNNLVTTRDTPEAVQRVIRQFSSPGARLITLSSFDGQEIAEVTHEALFGHWQLFNDWLDGSREDLRFQRRLHDAAVYWEQMGRPEGLLWRPPDLDLLQVYEQRNRQDMTLIEIVFFEASKSYHDRTITFTIPSLRTPFGRPTRQRRKSLPLDSEEESDSQKEQSELLNIDDSGVFIPQRGVGQLYGASNDLVAAEDRLGFEYYVKSFADLIESPYTEPPLTIGIFGSWGMGKSFLLDHITTELNNRFLSRLNTERKPENSIPCVYTVNFNAWEYGSAKIIWPFLVRKIMNRLEKEVRWYFPGRFAVKFWRNLVFQTSQIKGQLVFLTAIFAGLIIYAYWSQKSLLSVIGSASAALAIGSFIKLATDTLSQPLSQWIVKLFKESTYGEAISYMDEIRHDLEILAHNLEREKGRILVIIDDLDRCEPQKAVEVLQAIKLLLNFKGFVVCLGIDARVITRAIEGYYKDVLGPSGVSGYEYLEKIIQIPFHIPPPATRDIQTFISRQLFPDSTYEDLKEYINSFLNKKELASLKADTSLNDASESGAERQIRIPTESELPPISESEPLSISESEPPSISESEPLSISESEPLSISESEPLSISESEPPSISELPESELTTDNISHPASFTDVASREKLANEIQENTETYSLSAFTIEELMAFHESARLLRPNPRHLKRLVNIYRVVRSLATYRNEKYILDNPALTINWLILCSQWPYITALMLNQFEKILTKKNTKRFERFPDEDPLTNLFDQIKSSIDPQIQQKTDHNLRVFQDFIETCQDPLSWQDLNTLRRYTVSFNPAVHLIP